VGEKRSLGKKRGPRKRAARVAFQRFDTYIVISMPKRKSTAVGVSHFMVKVL